MVERQVIVTWYTPKEKLPEDCTSVLCTISGTADGVVFERAILPLEYADDQYGWLSYEYDFQELTVHAWCDLDAYQGN